MAFAIPAVLAAALPEAAGAAAAVGGSAITWAGAGATAATLADIGTAASVAGSAVTALGALKQGQAASEAASYQSQISANNAKLAKQNANYASEEGEINAANSEAKTRAAAGAILANQGASGVDVNSGSAVDVRSSAAQVGELNAINIRSDAARQAYGFQTQAASEVGQSAEQKAEAKNDITAGELNAATSFLGGASSASSKYHEFMLGNSLTGG